MNAYLRYVCGLTVFIGVWRFVAIRRGVRRSLCTKFAKGVLRITYLSERSNQLCMPFCLIFHVFCVLLPIPKNRCRHTRGKASPCEAYVNAQVIFAATAVATKRDAFGGRWAQGNPEECGSESSNGTFFVCFDRRPWYTP